MLVRPSVAALLCAVLLILPASALAGTPHVLAAWSASATGVGSDEEKVSTDGTMLFEYSKVAFEGSAPAVSRYSLPLSQIGCVTRKKSGTTYTIDVYPKTIGGVRSVTYSPRSVHHDDYLEFLDIDVGAMRALTSSPAIRAKLGACTGLVSLYHLKYFNRPPSARKLISLSLSYDLDLSALGGPSKTGEGGTGRFALYADSSHLFVDQREIGALADNESYVISLNRIRCIRRLQNFKVGIYPADRTDLLARDPGTGIVSTRDSVLVLSGSEPMQQRVLDALSSASPIVASKIGACKS